MRPPTDAPGNPSVAEQRMIRVDQPADVGEARRQGVQLAALLEFDADTTGRLALAITEAGTNIVKHAREGMVLVRGLARSSASAIEVLVLDKGQGIGNLALSMRDGYSTAGTPGGGLGALSRITSRLEIFSLPENGTALRFEIAAKDTPSETTRPAICAGGVSIAKPGEVACGDGWTLVHERGRYTLLVVDGLGHGVDAAIAARTAIDLTHRHAATSTALEMVQTLHTGLRGTRGAAAAVAVLEPIRGSGTFCGIGNISCTVRSQGDTRKMVSHNGILGHRSRNMHEFAFAFPPDATLIAHSDGLNTHWQLQAYPGLERFHPALIAGVLFRDHARGHDDATCVVLRHRGSSA